VGYTGGSTNTIMAADLPEGKINYRQEAQRIRAMARHIQDAEVRAQLLLVASLYEKLSEHLTPQPSLVDMSRPNGPTE
jgi:hypothetical protein